MTLLNIMSVFSKLRIPKRNTLCHFVQNNKRPKFLYSGLHEFSTSSRVQNRTLVDGINLHWERFGNGSHVTLCLPGLAGSIAQHFLPVSKKMNLEKFTLLAVDPPGYGKSRPPDRNVFSDEFCFETDARLAGKLMKKLGYDKYSILGFSNGGTTGGLLAATSPNSVQKLVMCNSPHNITAQTVHIMKLTNFKNWKADQLSSLLEDYEKDYAHKILNDWYKFVETHAGDVLFSEKVHKQFEKIRAPTLYIKSVNDPFIPFQDALDHGIQIKNLKLHTVTHGGHSHLQFLDEFVAATESFLSE